MTANRRNNSLVRGNQPSPSKLKPGWLERAEYRALNEKLPVVLVVEDDDAIQTLVETALTDAGFGPAIAPSGEEAVTLLQGRKSSYRTLVTDISLRGKMDGWEVAHQ